MARTSRKSAEETPDIVRAHEFSTHHRADIEASDICGCFYCLKTFPPAEITEWWDRDGQTPVCPKCGIDSVIASASGFPITRKFLREMHNKWFSCLPIE